MILIGQYDSPFVRRVGIAMKHYGLSFKHRPWSSFGDADEIRRYNPLTRVPALVLDDGETLVDSHMILDYLDSLMPEDKRLFPAREPERHRALKIAAIAAGISDKAVSLFYELRLHDAPSDIWLARCGKQIETGLAVLEADRASRPGAYWFGEAFGHCDIIVTTMLRHLHECLPAQVKMTDFPALAAHAAKMEALAVFQEIQQVFIAPT